MKMLLRFGGLSLFSALSACTMPDRGEDLAIQSRKQPMAKLHIDRKLYERLNKMPKGDKGKLLLYVNYSIPSNRERIWLINIDSIKQEQEGLYIAPYLYKGYAAHGEGRGSTVEAPEFSNEPNSHCSSQGLFRVAEFYTTTTGKDPAYRLDGLDESNSNIRLRGVVLHPRIEVDLFVKQLKRSWFPWGASPYIPFGLSISKGCVVVTHEYFGIVQGYKEQGYNIYGYVH